MCQTGEAPSRDSVKVLRKPKRGISRPPLGNGGVSSIEFRKKKKIETTPSFLRLSEVGIARFSHGP